MNLLKSFYLPMVFLLLGTARRGCAAQEGLKPNIIMIMAVDMGYGNLICYSSKIRHTPNIDRLAAEGMKFTDFHSNGAVCSPIRTTLLTCKYQQCVGIDGVVTAKNDRDKGLAPKENTFANSAKEAGYLTGMFGKWQIGYQNKRYPVNQGFDEYIGYVSGNVDYHSHIDQRGYEDWWTGDTLKKEEGYSTDLPTGHAVIFIERPKEEPFFLYVPHEAPHNPFQGHNSEEIRRLGHKNGPQHHIKRSQEELDILNKEMVEVMDEGIGEIMESLEDLELDRNTFVFFCSDNGGVQRVGSNGRLRGYKSTLCKGGHRVPAIAWCPDEINLSQINSETVHRMDVYLTIVGIIGTKIPSGVDGLSLKNNLYKDEPLANREHFFKSTAIEGLCAKLSGNS